MDTSYNTMPVFPANRFKIDFNTQQQPYYAPSITAKRSTPTNVSLNAPMIGRVHNVKPGCSACGKRVM